MQEFLMYLHLSTVLPCVPLGAYLLAAGKGGGIHKSLGKIYMSLMVFTALVALFIQAQVGPQWLGHFGWIHLFCLLTLYSVPTALLAIRRGDVRRHRFKLWALYLGAIGIAGGFAFWPGRFLHELFFT
jgi:uncharacterized membrane protein